MHRRLFPKMATTASFAAALAACGGGSPEHAEPAAAINDTGVITCVDSTLETIDCATAETQLDLHGQDGNYGRDALARQGKISKTGAGKGGFDFSKRGTEGDILPDQSQNWGAGGSQALADNWSCVTDHVTGLTWEVKSPLAADSAYTERTYTWYNPDMSNNGGDPGVVRGTTCAADATCNTAAYLAAINAAGLCGRNNWRLPTVAELLSIADQSRTNPPLDLNFFPNSSYNAHWTAQTVAADTSSAWYVYFTAAGNGSISKAGQAHLRAVSSDQ